MAQSSNPLFETFFVFFPPIKSGQNICLHYELLEKTQFSFTATFRTPPLTWSSCLLKLLKMSCLLTWKTGLPSLKIACTTTPSEYMSEAASQLTDRMYSGARYSGLGRQSGGRLGSHSLHEYLGWRGREDTRMWEQLDISYQPEPLAGRDRRNKYLGIWGVCGGDAEVEAHDLPCSTLVEDDVLWTQVAMNHLHPTVEERQTLRDLRRQKNINIWGN